MAIKDDLEKAGVTVIETPPGGMYGMVVGMHPLAANWLAALGLDVGSVPRFRDAWLVEKEGYDPHGNKLVINIHARCGKDAWTDDAQEEQWKKLQEHPEFIQVYNCEYDDTYSNMEFVVPEKLMTKLKELLSDLTPEQREFIVDNRTQKEMWDQAMERLDFGEAVREAAAAKENESKEE